MTERPWLVRVGAAAACLGLLLAVAGDAAAALTSNYLPVAVVGVAALSAGVARLLDRGLVDRTVLDLPTPEAVSRVPVPGDGFDALAADRRAGQRVRSHLRDRVRETLVAHHGCGEAEADRLIERGGWTADGVAAAYLGGETVRPPLGDRVRMALAPGPNRERRVRRTVAALAELREAS